MANLTAEDVERAGAIDICRAKGNACDTYATVAALQNRFNDASNCGFTGGRWSPDMAGHRRWCMSVNPAKTTAEMDLRTAALKSCKENGQLADVNLQNVLQKQQQTMQMLSNVSKMLHDTAMAVIRKMGG